MNLKQKLLFPMLLIVFSVSIISILLVIAYPYLEYRFTPEMAKLMASTLSDAKKQEIYSRLIATQQHMWEVVPEPNVARIGAPNTSLIASEAQVNFNNAGMRSTQPYLEKNKNSYRIVCLGDSFVMGEAGREEDRWCDQLGEWFHKNNITVNGKNIETIAIGLSSWTMLQETTYITSRLTAYSPDLILMLTVPNDITPSMGVTGLGLGTNEFSPEERQWGSGLFTNAAGWPFGGYDVSVTDSDFSIAGNEMRDKYILSMKRLAELQNRRHGKVLFSVLNNLCVFTTQFEDNFRKHFNSANIPAPQMSICVLNSNEYRLPHDGHPNQFGHSVLRDQYLLAIAQQGWINIPADKLPKLPKGIPVPRFNLGPVTGPVFGEEQWRREFLARPALTSDMDFAKLDNDKVTMFLGGIYPAHHIMENRYGETPYASIRAGFMLRTLENKPVQKVRVRIEIPDRVELLPLHIVMSLNDQVSQSFDFDKPGDQVLEMVLPKTISTQPLFEVTLISNHYFAEIEDHRMKVFKLTRATVTDK